MADKPELPAPIESALKKIEEEVSRSKELASQVTEVYERIAKRLIASSAFIESYVESAGPSGVYLAWEKPVNKWSFTVGYQQGKDSDDWTLTNYVNVPLHVRARALELMPELLADLANQHAERRTEVEKQAEVLRELEGA